MGATEPTGTTGPKGATGATGPAGKSAYQSAKDGGYTGTEAQFNTILSNTVTKSYVDTTIQTAIDGALAASY